VRRRNPCARWSGLHFETVAVRYFSYCINASDPIAPAAVVDRKACDPPRSQREWRCAGTSASWQSVNVRRWRISPEPVAPSASGALPRTESEREALWLVGQLSIFFGGSFNAADGDRTRRRPDDRHLGRAGPPTGCDQKKGGRDRCLARSRGGLITKIHAFVDAQWRPTQLKLTAGQASDIVTAAELTGHLAPGAMLLADRGRDANAPSALVGERGAWVNIPPKSNRKDPISFSRHLYRDRTLIERFFNKTNSYAVWPQPTTSSRKTSSQA